MGVTQRLGTIPLAIQTDSSNNVGIGGAANASYKLAVTGAAAFTSDLSVTGGSYYLQRASSSAILPVLRYWNGTGNPMNGGALGDILTIGTQGTNDFTIATDNTRRLTISSSGNVGIGTSSPQSLLDVKGATPFIRITDSSVTGETGLIMDAGGGFIRGALTINYGTGEFKISAGSAGNSYYQTFLVNGSERMRITSGGNVKASNWNSYINISGNYHEFSSNVANTNCIIFGHANASQPYGPWVYFNGGAPNNTTQYFFAGSDTVSDKFFIYSNGSMYNRTGTYGTISDIKFKENIVDATPKLEDLLKLKVRNFNMIGDETKQIGFIAQEFEEVFPAMVDTNTDKDGETHKAIKTSVLVPMLVKAIQELNAKVTALENK